MNKLKLQLDELAVESFETCAREKERGTVVGEQCTCGGPVTCAYTCPQTCDDYSCAPTCAYTCDDPSCAESCNGTCNEWTCQDSCGGTCWNPRCQDSNICP